MLSIGRKIGQGVEVRFRGGPSLRVIHSEDHTPVVQQVPKGVTAKVIFGVLHLRYKDQSASIRVTHYLKRWRLQVEACERIAIIRV